MFALIDINSAFASCETVFRPDLINKAVVVLSSNDGNIIARNKIAKDLGLKMFFSLVFKLGCCCFFLFMQHLKLLNY